MNSTLRLPVASDYAVIAAWIPDAASCLRWAGPRLVFPFTASELQARLVPVDGASYCLAEGEGAPLGFGQHWVVTPGAVHLGRIIVAPEARGQGLGRVLCRQLIAKAVELTEAAGVTLRVCRDNQAARDLYLSLGFVPVEAESTEDALFMRLPVRKSSVIHRR